MSMLKEAFEAGKFGVTAEMAPPKGYDFSEQLEAAKLLNGKVHGVNVTDMQSASLKASSLGLCVALKNAGIEPILQMTGRDRNRMAIMGDILSAAAFGIDTMLALTGDHPVVGDCPESKPVYDLDSVGILKMLTKMEQTNCDCGGNEIAGGAPKFYKGASVTPVYDPIELQINKLRQKVENGAEYIQTQGIFDLETFKRFLDKVDAAGIKTHIMAGIIPLKAAGMARYMNENVPGIAVPQDMIDKLAAAAAEGKEKGVKGLPMQLGIEMAAEMIAKIKDEHLCDGVHIMAIGAEKNVPAILEKAGVETVLFEAVTPDAVDFSAVVRKLRRAKADVLIFGGYQNTASKLVQQMRRDRVKTPLIGPDGVKDETFLKMTGKDSEGVMASYPKDTSTLAMYKHAREAHVKQFGSEPGFGYYNAYAATQALIKAIEVAGSTETDKIMAALKSTEVDTPLGKMAFNKAGDATGLGLSVYVVKDGKFVESDHSITLH